MGDITRAYTVVMKKPEEKGPLVMPRRTRADKVKTNLQEEEEEEEVGVELDVSGSRQS
jgi:hypothetical protein